MVELPKAAITAGAPGDVTGWLRKPARRRQAFAIKHKHRYVDCYSETEVRSRGRKRGKPHATYNIYAEPNK